MFDILEDLRRWVGEEKAITLCVVLETWGSSPRRAGAHMAVVPGGEVAGSVSGGCVESAVIRTALDRLTDGRASILHFGVSDDIAWEVGLACGGEIDILVMPAPTQFFKDLFARIDADGRAAYRVTAHADGKATLEVIPVGEWPVYPQLEREEDELRFYNPIVPGLELLLIGGGHLAQAIARLAEVLGYPVTVIEPRSVFAEAGRFPPNTRVIHAWPQDALQPDSIQPHHAVVSLTHDPKIDDPALMTALASPAMYVGALGSKKTHALRCERLARDGISESLLARLHGPVGLDLGSLCVEEMALEVLAEIMAMRISRDSSNEARKHPISKRLPPRA